LPSCEGVPLRQTASLRRTGAYSGPQYAFFQFHCPLPLNDCVQSFDADVEMRTLGKGDCCFQQIGTEGPVGLFPDGFHATWQVECLSE
jgi:hypothetical protein